MTTEAATIGLTHGASEDTGLGHRGPQSKSIVVPYGFWLFVLSDMVLFSALFVLFGTLLACVVERGHGSVVWSCRALRLRRYGSLGESLRCGLD